MMSLWRQARIGLQYLLFRRGPLTVSAGHAAAFVRTRPGAEASRRADLLHQFFHRASAAACCIRYSGFTASVSQLQVESRGSVHIRSADPRAPPAIRYNYLATENDRRVMVEGLKFIRRICSTPPLRDYVDSEDILPGARVQTRRGLARRSAARRARPCSIRLRPAAWATVVDARLRVKGILT